MSNIIEKDKHALVDKAFYSRCANCPIMGECDVFEEEFAEYTSKANDWYKDKVKDIEDKSLPMYQKQMQIDNLKEQRLDFAKRIAKSKSKTVCKFEEEYSKEIYNNLSKSYDLEKYPQCLPIISQIIKLQLKDFQVNLIHKRHGMLQYSRGQYKLMPGLHYSLEFSSKITELIKTMNDMIMGQKSLVINADINVFKAEDIFGTVEEITEK